MADLPTPLIAEILSKLPVKSLVRFRCVSKSWRSLIDDPHFIKLHLKHSLDNTTNHTLIIRYSYLYSVDFPTLDRAVEIDHPLKSYHHGSEVLGSCNGLLCLSNVAGEGKEGTILYNPATKRHQELPVSPIQFPDTAIMCERMVYGFGYDQVHDDYKVFRIIQFDGEDYDFYDSEMKVYSLKAKSWKRVRDFPREYYLTYKRAWGIYVNGCLHWVVTRKPESDGSNLIMAVDLCSEECKVVPQPKYSGSGDFQTNIGVLQGCLFVLCNYFKVRTDVWVMDEYGVEESWTKKFSVAQPEVMGFFDYVRPIAYSKDGTDVLLERDQKLVWFDLQRQRAKRVNVQGMPESIEVAMLVESLFPLESPMKNGQKRETKSKKKRDDLDGFLTKGFNLKL